MPGTEGEAPSASNGQHAPWSKDRATLFSDLNVSIEDGLSTAEAIARLQQFGPNAIRKSAKRSAIQILFDQCKSVIVALLAIAAVVSFLFGDHIEGLAIIAVIVANAFIGFVIELQATRSVESLRRLVETHSAVRRDGKVKSVPTEELVPGDIVVFEAGDMVGADIRVVACSNLQSNESILTGESAPVGKQMESVDLDAPLYARTNMLFKGTVLTNGSGEGIVTGTGMRTEFGSISSLIEAAKDETTPLEKRLDKLGRKLVGAMLLVASVTAVSGILAGKSVYLMLQTAIALTVAAIPEGLPIVATIALARGMRRMATKNALVNKLAAVETLGATTVICTDKTGTLTENRMLATSYVVDVSGALSEVQLNAEGRYVVDETQVDFRTIDSFRTALEIGVLCNNASLETGQSDGEAIGDPLEVALLVAAENAGLDRAELLERYPEANKDAFDAERKMMGTVHRANDSFRIVVKGALEEVLDACTSAVINEQQTILQHETREAWLQYNLSMAERGLRIIAFAEKYSTTPDGPLYSDLTFVGLVGLADPPRKGVREALGQCRRAGIRAVMVTGDQAPTALSVARSLELLEEAQPSEVLQGSDIELLHVPGEPPLARIHEVSIFARVSPKQKLDLVTLYQEAGEIVAMTGDGVNDAPALKKADIGVAMGLRGTEAAREASDMVLKDDAFSTIVAAIEEGRIIFNNIRKFVIYLMSCNLSEILVVGIASAFRAPLPLLPLQILFLNLVTDVFPALALGMSRGTPSIMERPPRDPNEAVLEPRHWTMIVGYSVLITCSTLGAFWWALDYYEAEMSKVVTVSFLVLAFAQLWHVFNVRDSSTEFFESGVVRNFHIWAALAFCTLLLLGAVFVTPVAQTLKVAPIDLSGWFVVVGASLLPCLIGQALLLIRRLRTSPYSSSNANCKVS